MPPLLMRGRYLMREYWSDSALFLRLSAGEREVYVGLWMLADDAGWLVRDVPGIAAALYRYEDPVSRESRIREALDHLRRLDKLKSYRCGCLWLPAVAKYPRAGNKRLDYQAAHAQHGSQGSNKFDGIQTGLNPLRQTYSNPSPDVTLPDPTSGARARARKPTKIDRATLVAMRAQGQAVPGDLIEAAAAAEAAETRR